MPYEFTEEGMLQRVNTYISHQDFCTQLRSPWVPRESVQFVLSRAGQSCQSACMEKRESHTQHYSHVLFPLTHMFTHNDMITCGNTHDYIYTQISAHDYHYDIQITSTHTHARTHACMHAHTQTYACACTNTHANLVSDFYIYSRYDL